MNKIVGTSVCALMAIASAHGHQVESGPVHYDDPVALTLMAEAGYERRLSGESSSATPSAATGGAGPSPEPEPEPAAPSPDSHAGHDHGPSPAAVSAASPLQAGMACLAISAASAAYVW